MRNFLLILFSFTIFTFSREALLAQSQALPERTEQPPFPPSKDWPQPVEHINTRMFVLADVLEYRASRKESDFRWDAEGWYGGDYNRLWFKSEGERNTALKASYDIDLQLLYGRFVKRYYDFQVGARVETQSFQGRNVTRTHAVIGFEGLVRCRFEIEPLLFISQNG